MKGSKPRDQSVRRLVLDIVSMIINGPIHITTTTTTTKGHTSGLLRTEQEPHPQLEQSPLQEQDWQLLYEYGQLTFPLPCTLDIRVFPASARCISTPGDLGGYHSPRLGVCRKTDATYQGDMVGLDWLVARSLEVIRWG